MSFFSKVGKYFGSSSDYSKAASDRLNTATKHAKEVATNITDGVVYIAPKIASVPSEMDNVAVNTVMFVGGAQVANAAVCGANAVANLAGYGFLNTAASATSYIAPAFISPLGVAAVAATSFIATHPNECFEFIKGAGNTAYIFVKAGANLAAAAYDITVAGVIVAVGVASDIEDQVVDGVSEYATYSQDLIRSLAKAASEGHFVAGLYSEAADLFYGNVVNLAGVDEEFVVLA